LLSFIFYQGRRIGLEFFTKLSYSFLNKGFIRITRYIGPKLLTWCPWAYYQQVRIRRQDTKDLRKVGLTFKVKIIYRQFRIILILGYSSEKG